MGRRRGYNRRRRQAAADPVTGGGGAEPPAEQDPSSPCTLRQSSSSSGSSKETQQTQQQETQQETQETQHALLARREETQQQEHALLARREQEQGQEQPPADRAEGDAGVVEAPGMRLRKIHPSHIPVIVDVKGLGNDVDEQYRGGELKLLCPDDMTTGSMQYVVRKKVKMDEFSAMFILTLDGQLPPTSRLVGSYQHGVDGLVRLRAVKENTFGGSGPCFCGKSEPVVAFPERDPDSDSLQTQNMCVACLDQFIEFLPPIQSLWDRGIGNGTIRFLAAKSSEC
jgi:hypothetical protein